MQTAAKYLGHPYSISGKVVKGQQLGRTIGYPTANVVVDDVYKLIPADGIYAVKVKHNNKTFNGMLSIGNNPTVAGKGRSIEVNIFDFNETIYGDTITICFVEWLRNELKFNSLEELKVQLAKDESNSKQIAMNKEVAKIYENW